jgi:peptidyl-prolyl cis-trans isomerase A (cyclophilin A)
MARRSLFIATLLLALAAWPRAQETRGELFGVVKDTTGALLPGVTVTITGPGLTAPRVAVTNASGAYRFDPVPAGTYAISFKIAGWGPLAREIVVVPGSHAAFDASLTASALSLDSELGRLGFKPGEVAVQIETALGRITLAVDAAHAPITAANFLKYVEGKFYDGGRFHRATRPDNYTPAPPNRPAMEIVQAGINPSRQAQAFPAIALERTSVTGLKHVAGTVSMARGTAADTATSDFFILLDDQPSLDFGGKRFDDGQGAAAFGRVLFGINVVKQIQKQPAEGQELVSPVTILWATRTTR